MVEKTVLIVTPFVDFGELISQFVSKNKPWQVKIVSTLKALADTIDDISRLDYALMDMEMGFEKVKDSVFIVRDKFPLIQLILISKNELPEEAENLRPWRLLSKPFIESDLLEIFANPENYHYDQVIDAKFQDIQADTIPLWSQDKDQVKSIMMNTIAGLDAQAAIIFKDNEILFQTENMQTGDINDCSFLKYKYLDSTGQGELIKQVSLPSNNYLLHMTVLAVGIILAVLYSPDISFNIVRNQTRYITLRINNPQLSSMSPNSLPDSVLTMEKERTTKFSQNPHSVNLIKETPQRKVHPRSIRKFKRGKPLGSDENQYELDQSQGIPPEAQEKLWSFNVPEADPGLPNSRVSNQIPVSDPSFSFQSENVSSDSVSQASNGYEPETRSIRQVEKGKNPIYLNLPNTGATQLDFTVMLIPRIKSHALVGDISRCLNEEVPTIFLANGWRLESLIISRQFMQWSVSIPSSIAPSNHIKTIRRESSRLVLGNFTRLSRDGLIADFWAPGFLLESGKCHLSDDVIAEFIQANRQQYYPDERVYQIPEASFAAN
jgi:hypothetical protein